MIPSKIDTLSQAVLVKCLLLCLHCFCFPAFANDGFFKAPKNWKTLAKDKLPASVQQMAKGRGKKELPPSVNLVVENTKLDIEKYTELVREIHLANHLSSWIKLGTIDTLAGEAVLTQIKTKSQWGSVRMLQSLLISENRVYIMTASALEEEFPKFYKEFFTSIQSLQLAQK